jgi:hypothetical protein
VSNYPTFLTSDGAHCNPKNADLFVPDRVELGRVGRAKTLCRGCPLRAPCLAWGRAHRESGIWGAEELHNGRVVRRGQTRALL